MFSVEAHNVVKRFGTKTVLNGITFSHPEGVLGIAGPNGSGKSTLLKCLSGLLKPTSGSITWKSLEGELSDRELKSRLGYVAPYINLYPELTILENLNFIIQLRKMQMDRDSLERQLGRLQLHEIRHQAVGELSTGQLQRTRLACSLAYRPSILFLDEPGANLDEQGTNLIRTIVDQSREEGRLVLLASNNREELNLADRVISVVND